MDRISQENTVTNQYDVNLIRIISFYRILHLYHIISFFTIETFLIYFIYTNQLNNNLGIFFIIWLILYKLVYILKIKNNYLIRFTILRDDLELLENYKSLSSSHLLLNLCVLVIYVLKISYIRSNIDVNILIIYLIIESHFYYIIIISFGIISLVLGLLLPVSVYNLLLNLLGFTNNIEVEPDTYVSIIDDLPDIKLSSLNQKLIDSSETELQCTICLDNIKPDDFIVNLPCNHLYHKNCIRNWFINNNTCPVCRINIPAQIRNLEVSISETNDQV